MKQVSEAVPFIAYGGDYNPEQWSEEVWIDDAQKMQKAGVNLVSVAIFSWAVLEKEEGVFNFAWLDKVLDILHEHGVGVCLATATASTPAWLSANYPDVAAVDQNGQPYNFGSRQHYSPNSPTYKKAVKKLVRKLAERYCGHPALKMWHINNEYGCHVSECYSRYSTAAFREWLENRYQSMDELNERWGTNFWSQRYNDWEEIELPVRLATFYNPGQMLDYKRFMNHAIFQLYKIEKEILREVTPDVPVFTNFMYQFKPLDYFEWAEELDVVTWDAYPDPREGIPYSSALHHDLMRSLKQGQPFLLMEQAASHVNWRDINLTKEPGIMRLWSYSAIGHGADGIMFFQWRQAKAGAEKFHSAMIPHSNSEESRVYQEVKQLGQELKKLNSLVGARTTAKVAIVFDWENWWAVELEGKPHNKLAYMEQIKQYYKVFYDQNLAVDFVRAQDDLSGYELVAAPMLYMIKPGDAENLEQFTANGGTLVVSFFSGIADENDRIHLGGYPAPLRRLLGLRVEEFVPYAEEESKTIVYNGQKAEAFTWTDIIMPEGAEVAAYYEDGWYMGKPAITRHTYGKGKAVYIGTQPESVLLERLLGELASGKHLKAPLHAPQHVEILRRDSDDYKHLIIVNHNDHEIELDLEQGVSYTDLLSGELLESSLCIKAVDVKILRF
ncbi:beta-galactosidase [Sediminibacillus albus]|uniref:Beta-galactosidase n=1 Tax=Sediminibacillus albus TaxID=407036 RepID=A0A1G8YE96_9BACI|nr:beta-galactosidase [Sediminibacillus albus]SDK00983.1 beta-galactosidase [Sediminibacillus albus]